MPTVAYSGALQVLALISVCNRNYVIQGWHGALLTSMYSAYSLVQTDE